jgi:DNA-binding MurR/RpiR family transcriptional regulator
MTASLPVAEGGSLRIRLAHCFTNFPPAEQKVAFFLLHSGDKYQDFTLLDLATHAGVSKAVVVRMCQQMGLSGFRDFRLRWVKETAKYEMIEETSGSVEDPGLLSHAFTALKQEVNMLSADALEQAASVMIGAKRLFIYASGGSNMIGQLAATAFSEVGLLAITFNEAIWRLPDPTNANGETAILAISHRGKNERLEEIIKNDRARGATVVLLTSVPGSDLTYCADICLYTGSPAGNDNRELEKSAARIVQITALQVLTMQISNMLVAQSCFAE